MVSAVRGRWGLWWVCHLREPDGVQPGVHQHGRLLPVWLSPRLQARHGRPHLLQRWYGCAENSSGWTFIGFDRVVVQDQSTESTGILLLNLRRWDILKCPTQPFLKSPFVIFKKLEIGGCFGHFNMSHHLNANSIIHILVITKLVNVYDHLHCLLIYL